VIEFLRGLEWRRQAACLGFAHEEASILENWDEYHDADARMLTLCADCPVWVNCLDYALSERITIGIWGDSTERERKSVHEWLKRVRLSDRSVFDAAVLSVAQERLAK